MQLAFKQNIKMIGILVVKNSKIFTEILLEEPNYVLVMRENTSRMLCQLHLFNYDLKL